MMLVFLLASLASLAAPPMVELPQDEVTRYVGEDSLYLYTLYMAERNSNAGGDGFLTTEAPDSASDDQRNESALGDSLEFRTPVLLSDFRIAGRTTANPGEYKIPLNVFLRATGGQQDVATYTFTLKVDTAGGEITKATEQKEMNACDSILPGGCGWNQVVINLKWTGAQEFTVIADGQLKLFISAESSCEGSSGGPFSPSCDAEVAWGKPDDITDYSSMEFWANALAGSSVRLQQPGALWTDPEVVDWYPNSMPDDRKMNFTVDVRDSLGRFDIQSVSVQLQDPSGTYVVDHSFSDNELVEDNNGLRGVYQWVHPANVEHGEYELTLEVIDIQGHSVRRFRQVNRPSAPNWCSSSSGMRSTALWSTSLPARRHRSSCLSGTSGRWEKRSTSNLTCSPTWAATGWWNSTIRTHTTSRTVAMKCCPS